MIYLIMGTTMGTHWFFFLLSVHHAICLAKLRNEENINDFLFPKDQPFEFVDLSYTYNDGRRGESGSCTGNICVNLTPNNMEEFSSWNHHNRQGKLVENIPPHNLILPLIIADLSDKVNNDCKFVLQKYHLDFFLNNYFGRTYQPCLIVFKFGWTEHTCNNNHYHLEENENNNNKSYPGISEDLAKWITRSYKNIVGIGVDVPSVDPGAMHDAPALKALTDAGVYVLGNVKLDRYLPEASCTAIVSPLKVTENCSPYRLLAVCPKSKMTPREFRIHRL